MSKTPKTKEISDEDSGNGPVPNNRIDDLLSVEGRISRSGKWKFQLSGSSFWMLLRFLLTIAALFGCGWAAAALGFLK